MVWPHMPNIAPIPTVERMVTLQSHCTDIAADCSECRIAAAAQAHSSPTTPPQTHTSGHSPQPSTPHEIFNHKLVQSTDFLTTALARNLPPSK